MDTYVDQVNQAAAYIKSQTNNFQPRVALTLGSGLAKLKQLIKVEATIPYTNIPNFPTLTVPGHEGNLIFGYLETIPVMVLSGRKHYYEVAHESDPMGIITFPTHVAAGLGCQIYLTTNAAGGLNPRYHVGDLMVIESHIGFFIPNPLLGIHHDFGNNLYFQPQADIYTPSLRLKFLNIDSHLHQGVYVCLSGRTYETKAECIALRVLGADAVGMSTVPEIIIAHHRGMQTMGVSIITNAIDADGTNATNHEEVTSVLNSSATEEFLFNTFSKFFNNL